MMKNILFIAAFLPMSGWAQSPKADQSGGKGHFTINGNLGNYNAPAKVYFDHMEGDVSKSDSAILVNGHFQFSGSLDGPASVRMAFTPRGDGKERAIYIGDVKYFYIGNESITIQSKDSLAHCIISGSPVDSEFEAFTNYIGGSMMAITKQANEEFNAGSPAQKGDTAFAQAVDRHFREKIHNRNEKMLEFAKLHRGSFCSLIALSELANSSSSVAAVQPVFDALDLDLRDSFTGRDLAKRMAALSSVVAGNMAPDFSENDLNDQPVTLSKLKGQYVLVDFWASWCGPCRAENPNLKKQYDLYKSKGFQVLSVSLDDNKTKWRDAVIKDGMPWLQVSDLRGWNNEAGKLYGVRGVPASFLIDPQGKIVATGLRGEALNKKLATIFN